MSWSYTSTRIGLTPRFSEALNLYRVHSQNMPAHVQRLIRRLRDIDTEKLRALLLTDGVVL